MRKENERVSVTEKVARFIGEIRYEDIPAEAVSVAKGAIMDCLGVSLAAVDEESSRIIVDFVQEMGGSGRSAIIGAGTKTSPPNAALANGTMAHALDYDDVVASMAGHPSAPVVPAVLALGDHIGASGRDVVTAYVVGYEVETKLGLAIGPSFYAEGWHPTAILGTMGAAAASAKIIGLSPEKCAIALAIAGSHAAGLRQNFGSFSKPFHAGNAARSGLVAAILAKKGFTANAEILDGLQSFLNVFGERTESNLELLAEGLGNPYDIVTTRPSMKAYPCCAATHRPIDATLHIVMTEDLDPQSIESIVCTVPEHIKKLLIHSNPRTGLQGKFSLEYTVSSAAVDRWVGMRTFEEDQMMRPEVRSLMSKVRWNPQDGPYPSPMAATIRLEDGREFYKLIEHPKGSPQVPMTPAELEKKYRDCASRALAKGDVERSHSLIAELESLPDIRLLTELLSTKK